MISLGLKLLLVNIGCMSGEQCKNKTKSGQGLDVVIEESDLLLGFNTWKT